MAAATNDLGLVDALVSGRDVFRRSLVKVLDCVVMVVARYVTTNSPAPAPSTAQSTEADDTPQPLNGSTTISQVVPVQGIGGRHSVPPGSGIATGAWARFATASDADLLLVAGLTNQQRPQETDSTASTATSHSTWCVLS